MDESEPERNDVHSCASLRFARSTQNGASQTSQLSVISDKPLASIA